ncbi:carbonic anhydrase [Schizopora paradoxa]|uniref:Carbonic anhydrase n=1 Tax=Schizopora paradoxa TaxID=27342 RepID=A0A0H2RXT0_9AGAM|nr:carbonic anhydrase [Schizopora paradoxa]
MSTSEAHAHHSHHDDDHDRHFREVDPGSLLKRNRAWVEQRDMTQKPKVLWIGCSDSRVSESIATMSPPGVIFTQRNIANQFMLEDMNAQSVLEYAVTRVEDHGLGVDHVVVVGHTQCGGVKAAMEEAKSPHEESFKRHAHTTNLVKWLGPLVALVEQHPGSTEDEICELNVKAQMKNVKDALNLIDCAKNVRVHGWVYELHSGLLRDLEAKA